jgi:NAD(P)-dependent dehydrogenase (short-subunit alcohol dehydrogenase family)
VGINHLGHFALVGALTPMLQRAKNGFRVINVSSDAHRFVDKKSMAEALDAKLDSPSYAAGGWGAYGVSKAANVLFTVELERRLEAAGARGTAVSLHPGVVQTDLSRYIVGGVAAEDAHPTSEAPEPTGVAKFLKSNVLDKAILTVDRGANTQVWLAAAADSGGDRTKRGGVFFDKMRAVAATDAATDGELARRLWDLSEALTGTRITF